MTALYFLYKYIIFLRAIIHSRNVRVSKFVMKSERYCGRAGHSIIIKSEVNKMEQKQKGIIFTAIPDESNEYYEPFYEELIYFNENLNEKRELLINLFLYLLKSKTFIQVSLNMMIFG